MNAMKALVAVGAVVAGMVLWDTFKPAGGLTEVVDRVGDSVKPASASAAGFAERLASLLSSNGIAYRRATAADYNNLTSQEEANRVLAVMNGPIPIVYVNGRAKSNPAPDEVVAEYHRGKSG